MKFTHNGFEITVLKEDGYEIALMGLGLSYKDELEDFESWWDESKFNKMKKVAVACAKKGGGHDKFLESMQTWFMVRASLNWHIEMDTYRSGMSKQSGSTMHTLTKRPLVQANFNTPILEETLWELNRLIEVYKKTAKETTKQEQKELLEIIKDALPSGYCQTRIFSTNYKCLMNIVRQRKGHRLISWNQFLEGLECQLEHSHFLPFGDV